MAQILELERRVAARIEARTQGLDIRYVVTNLDGGGAEWLYDTLYCARGGARAARGAADAEGPARTGAPKRGEAQRAGSGSAAPGRRGRGRRGGGRGTGPGGGARAERGDAAAASGRGPAGREGRAG